MNLQSIQKARRANTSDAVFSILIPSWNNLSYLQTCVRSIRQHSEFKHQIIVHINEGKDGTLEWLKEQPDIDYSYSTENVGVCYALNIGRSLVATEYILYLNDDMYVLPGWDIELYNEMQKTGHPYFFFSATAIESVAQSGASIQKNYGTGIADFREAQLLEEFKSLPMEDWHGATWPPNLVHVSVWDLVGGYSVEFSPGMYSDPDFSMKLWQAGIRIFKGLSKSRVYHFGSVTVNKITKNKGYHLFISKWGMTPSTLADYFLLRNKPISQPPDTRIPGAATRLKAVAKRVFAAFKGLPSYKHPRD